MTVAQLIDLLNQQPPNLVILVEGCDSCVGEADGIEPREKEVVIARGDSAYAASNKIRPSRA